MRELSDLSFEEIAASFDTSPGVARQTVYEARLSLRQMEEGREMSCDEVMRAVSDGDRRVLRRKDIRAHLRACESCAALRGRNREPARGSRRPVTDPRARRRGHSRRPPRWRRRRCGRGRRGCGRRGRGCRRARLGRGGDTRLIGGIEGRGDGGGRRRARNRGGRSQRAHPCRRHRRRRFLVQERAGRHRWRHGRVVKRDRLRNRSGGARPGRQRRARDPPAWLARRRGPAGQGGRAGLRTGGARVVPARQGDGPREVPLLVRRQRRLTRSQGKQGPRLGRLQRAPRASAEADPSGAPRTGPSAEAAPTHSSSDARCRERLLGSDPSSRRRRRAAGRAQGQGARARVAPDRIRRPTVQDSASRSNS